MSEKGDKYTKKKKNAIHNVYVQRPVHRFAHKQIDRLLNRCCIALDIDRQIYDRYTNTKTQLTIEMVSFSVRRHIPTQKEELRNRQKKKKIKIQADCCTRALLAPASLSSLQHATFSLLRIASRIEDRSFSQPLPQPHYPH